MQTESATNLLADHLSAFIEYQNARNCSRGYTRKIDQRVTRLIQECGWKRIRDVTAESFIAWRHAQTLSPKTLNDYQHAIFALLNWLKKTGRIEINPVEQVGRVDGCGKQTFKRRAFTDDEACRLLAVSDRRRPIYLLALHTGLRLGELRALRWEDIDLDRQLIRLRAETTKAKRADVLPLTPAAHSILNGYGKPCPASGPVFTGGVPSHHTFKADLKAAGINRKDERGHKVDFHALRTTFVTNLARAGVPQRQAMALARHTDPRLTANIYTDQDALPLAEAVAKLPAYGMGNNPKDAHGRSQELVSGSPVLSQPVIESNELDCSVNTAKPVLSDVNKRQQVTPKDTKQKWSRGESNGRRVHYSPRKVA